MLWKPGQKEKKGLLWVVPCIFISKGSCYGTCWMKTQAPGPQLSLPGVQGELIIDPGAGKALSRYCFWQICQVHFQRIATTLIKHGSHNFDKTRSHWSHRITQNCQKIKLLVAVQDGLRSFVRFIHSSGGTSVNALLMPTFKMLLQRQYGWEWEDTSRIGRCYFATFSRDSNLFGKKNYSSPRSVQVKNSGFWMWVKNRSRRSSYQRPASLQWGSAARRARVQRGRRSTAQPPRSGRLSARLSGTKAASAPESRQQTSCLPRQSSRAGSGAATLAGGWRCGRAGRLERCPLAGERGRCRGAPARGLGRDAVPARRAPFPSTRAGCRRGCRPAPPAQAA